MKGCSFYRRGDEPLTERHVQALWYDRDLRPPQLVTRDGRPLRVVYPGDWNLGAGPDFRNAVLEVGSERTRLAGDVEVHLRPGDWELHGHGGDEAYRRVVAHVTWGCGPEPATLPRGAVSVWIGRFVAGLPGFSPDQIDLGAYPFARLPVDERPCARYLKNDPDLAAEVLSAAGGCRLRAKARRLRRLLDGFGTDSPSPLSAEARRQVFYEEVMNALGYKRNARGFRSVARAVPLAAVEAEPENAAAAFLAAAAFAAWSHGGVRPHNRPEVRLAAAAELFTKTPMMALADMDDFSSAGCRAAIGAMTAGGWVGRGRAGAVLANVIAPFAMAEERLAEAPAWLPPEDLSEPVRLTAFRLFGRDHNPAAFYARDDVKIQGLIQIHRDYCLQVHPDCGDCGLVGTELRQLRACCAESSPKPS